LFRLENRGVGISTKAESGLQPPVPIGEMLAGIAARTYTANTIEVGGPIDITIGLVYRGLSYAYFADAEFETFNNHL
jgi:hypothetical protein